MDFYYKEIFDFRTVNSRNVMHIEKKFNQPSYHGHDCGIRFPKCQCCWFRSNRFNESKKSYNFHDTVLSIPTFQPNVEK